MSNKISTSPKRHRRVFLWFFLAVQALFAWWVIAGIASGSGNTTDAENVGTGIGVALIIGLWFFVNLFIGLAYGIYKLASRKDS